MSTLARALICSSVMWPTVASPDVAQRTAPGLARAAASSEAKSLPSNAGVASSTTGENITLTTGTMSLSGSYPTLPMCGLSTSGLIAANPIV